MTTTVGDLKYQLDNINLTATILGLVDERNTEVIIPKEIKIITTTTTTTYRVTAIGEYAFNNDKPGAPIKFKKVTFETNSQLETIGDKAFAYTLINSVVIPKTVKTIGYKAFQYSKLKSLTFEDNSQLETIGDNAFQEISMDRIVIPKTVKIIGESAFKECHSLKRVIFEGDKPTIGRGAFADISHVIPALGIVDENTYPNWKGVDKIDILYINKKIYTDKIFFRILPLIPLLILLLLNGYYFIITHNLLTNMLLILPLTLLIIVLVPLGLILKNEYMYGMGGLIPTLILSVSFIIGTFIKSKWSLLYRLPMALLLLTSIITGWFGVVL